MKIYVKALPEQKVKVTCYDKEYISEVTEVNIESDGTVTYIIYDEGSNSCASGFCEDDFELID